LAEEEATREERREANNEIALIYLIVDKGEQKVANENSWNIMSRGRGESDKVKTEPQIATVFLLLW
jgi:hypothetical protein